MDKTISSFQEQNERQQNKTVYEYSIYEREYDYESRPKIEKMLNTSAKEGWRVVSSSIYTYNGFHGPENHIGIILERPIKT